MLQIVVENDTVFYYGGKETLEVSKRIQEMEIRNIRTRNSTSIGSHNYSIASSCNNDYRNRSRSGFAKNSSG